MKDLISYAAFLPFALVAMACSAEPEDVEDVEALDESVSYADAARLSVFTMTNDPAANAVVGLRRNNTGNLEPVVEVFTQGKGTGAGLGSQGAVLLDKSGKWLFTVNAGTNSIASFKVGKHSLTLRSVVDSGGEQPVSVTLHGDTLYVLNAAGAGNIVGFKVDDGDLEEISGSMRPLSGAPLTAAAQVQFTPDGGGLVVTEKATNLIDTYSVGADGTTTGPVVSTSHGQTPFGFAFNKHETLIVSEAFGGAPNASKVSSYMIESSGMTNVVTPSIGVDQSAACWVAVTKNGQYAYVTNTGSNTISVFSVDHCGALAPVPGSEAVPTSAGPTDMAVVGNKALYVLASTADEIQAYSIQGDGSLTATGAVIGVPVAAAGLAAR
ncbi:MAG: beta-propeller fold lactonase family protein [Polyangiaceae bacterium]